jgi:FxsC-like protein
VLYFFLSYARGDDDPYVRRFFHDLSREVRIHAGLPGGYEVGFLDSQSLQHGEPWPEGLRRALGTARTFLALCSPAYFNSKACGSEWAAFADRVRRYHLESRISPGSLLPLPWFPVNPLPAATAELQWGVDLERKGPLDGGVRQLLRLRRYRDRYLQMVSDLAQTILSRAAYDLPPLQQDLASFPSAFHDNDVRTPYRIASSGHPPEVDDVGVLAGHVHFVVAAPSRDEAAQIRGSADYYGRRAEDWAPYRPVQHDPIADYARQVAERRHFAAEVTTLEHLRERIVAARKKNQLVVLLVDPWITRIDRHRKTLRGYDRSPQPGIAILIPMAHSDRETQANSLPLSAAVYETLRNSADNRDTEMFHFAISDTMQFDTLLEQTLEAAQNQVFVHGTVHRLPPGETVGVIPRFEGSY